MRAFSRPFAVVALYATAALVASSAQAAGDPPPLEATAGTAAPGEAVVYVAREFLTMDAKRPRAEAVAVRDGRFVAVGTRAEVQAAAGEGARVDASFADETAIAGFVEQHVHPLLAALTMNTSVISIEDWDASDGFSAAVRDEESYLRRLKEALAAHTDASKPFVTWGYHHYFHGERISRALLDELAPGFPVIIWHRSCHEFFLNSRALAQVGIDEAFVAGLSAAQRAQVDLAKGHFFEQGALVVLDKLLPLLASPERLRRGLELTEAQYHRAGITLACEPGGFFSKPLQDEINAVYGDAATPFDHCFMADGKSFAARHPDDPAALVADSELVLGWGSGRTWYLPKQVKLFTDGAIYSQLMMMKDGYSDGHEGAWIMDPPVFDYAFQSYWDAGYQIHVHNNGDAGLDVLIGSLERAMARNPRQDHRTVLIHFGFARPEQVKRWAELGGIVSANPYYVTVLADRYAKLGIGPARARNMVPLGDVVKNGVSLSFHSDMPMAPAKPMLLVWAAVNRTTAEGPVAGPEHRVSLDTALRAVTLDAAFSIQQEKRIGSIEVGKDANLTLLEQDPYAVAPAKLKDVAVWGTMLAGRVQPAPPAGGAAALAAGSTSGADVELQRAVLAQLEFLMSHTE